MKTAPHTTDAPAELSLGEVEDSRIVGVPTPVADLFASLDALRVASDEAEESLVEAVLSHVPVRKPAKEWFFRIHPEYSLDTLVLEMKEDGETLLVVPAMRGALMEEKCASIRTLRLGVNRQGTPFIWPVRQPTEGRRDSWATACRKLPWGHPLQRGMRSLIVVFFAVFRTQDFHYQLAGKELNIQELIPQPGVKALRVGVLPWRSGVDVERLEPL